MRMPLPVLSCRFRSIRFRRSIQSISPSIPLFLHYVVPAAGLSLFCLLFSDNEYSFIMPLYHRLQEKAIRKIAVQKQAMPPHTGCPGSKIMQIQRRETPDSVKPSSTADSVSKLQNWPVQIKLAPINAPYFDGARLLIAADCAAYAYAAFHERFIKGHITLVGCPKLDSVDYSEKLTEIIRENNIKSVTVVRMEVPCCGGLEHAAVTALKNSGKFVPWQVVTISTDGRILDR